MRSSAFKIDILKVETWVAFYFLLLLFWGTSFSKLSLSGPLYLHDIMLITMVLFAVVLKQKLSTINMQEVFFITILALFYLIYSCVVYEPEGEILLMTMRQFQTFVYLFCYAVLFNLIIRRKEDIEIVIRFVKIIAITSVILQTGYILYGLAFKNGFSLFSESEYNYFSPLVIFGVVAAAGMVLAYEKDWFWLLFKYILICFLSTTMGHSSAFLAVFGMGAIYFFIRISFRQKLLALAIVLAASASLFLLPQFTDVNASWRLLYWQHIWEGIAEDNMLIFGHGFGQEYMSESFARYLSQSLKSDIMLHEYFPLARYLNPPHNSLLTLTFHVGLIPVLIFFRPLKAYFQHIFIKKISIDSHANFLIYVLTGSLTWISFNVILELPHASSFFWLIYFSANLYLSPIHATMISELEKA